MDYFFSRFRSFHWAGPQRPSQDGPDMDPDPENGIVIEGFLCKRAENILKTWQRRWFQVQNNQLMYLKRSKEPRVVMEDLRMCTVQYFRTFRRHFCFKVVSSTKSYMLAADSEWTRLAWTRAINDAALVSQPRPDDSQKWSHQEEPAAPGAPDDLRESVHGIAPPCNDDLGRETTGTHPQVLKSRSPAQGVHRASSPSSGAVDTDCMSSCTCVDPRASSPCNDLESMRTGTPLVQISSSPSNGCFWTKYALGKELGKGGYGSVSAAVCKADGRQVAIKYVYKLPTMKYITIPGEAESRPAEVALMMMVSRSPRCDNIIELLEWYDHPKYFVLVLEKPSPCMDLAEYIKDGPLSEDVAQIIMAQVVLAVCHCSARGVLHQDIKMENILVNPDDLKIKLIDFGCSDLLQTTPYRGFAGTWFNITPELLAHHHYHGCPATVWSLGVLQFTVVCGDLPFKNLDQILEGDLQFTRNLSAACCHLIRSCLAKQPDDRPSLGEILDHEWFGFHQ